jgi:hypothetical protein
MVMSNDANANVVGPMVDEPVKTFKTKGTRNNEFEVTVKVSFFKEGFDPGKITIQELLKDQELFRYLHNPAGPAIVNVKNGYKSYWLNGKPLTEEDAAKLQHNSDFNKTFDQIVEG